MKSKFINTADDVVHDMLQGLVASDASVTLLPDAPNVIIRADYERLKRSQVTILTGGGSGHEPAFGGYVGAGFLTAAVCGGVFASPTSSSVLAALRAACGPAGCLLIVMNYTGDRLNFGMAVERARAEGLNVSMLIVADDCALPRSKGITGRRGVAGTILVQKIACAAAEARLPLLQVLEEAKLAAANVGSMAIAFSSCTLPGQPLHQRLSGGTIEVGLGIHGEAGAYTRAWAPANELADVMIAAILGENKEKSIEESYLPIYEGDKVVVTVNNLGGTTQMEELVVTKRVLENLKERGIDVCRIYRGHFMTALDMEGISITIMKVDLLALARLDAVSSVRAWTGGTFPASCVPIAPLPHTKQLKKQSSYPSKCISFGDKTTVKAGIEAACEALKLAESELTEWDRIAGDGDCGATFARGADALMKALATYGLPFGGDLSVFLMTVGDILKESMGGTIGAILEIFFVAAALVANDEGWAGAVSAGCKAIQTYGGAERGQRTILDALIPFSETFSAGGGTKESFLAGVHAARCGAEETRNMQGQAGRANYVDQSLLKGVPDPGAMACAIVLEAIRDVL